MTRGFHVARLVRSTVRGLATAPYESPEGIRMDLNTNLFGTNPAVGEALGAIRAGKVDLAQYPSEAADRFRSAYAAAHGLEMDQVVAGNGSDEVMDLITKTFTDPGDRLVAPTPSFTMYPHYSRVNACTPVDVQLTEPWGLDPERFLRPKGKIIILCRPNNPTGNSFAPGPVRAVIEGTKGIVVLDEAYVEFADGDLLRWIDRYDNLLVSRTLSKAYGLAGLRLGLALGNADLVREVLRVKAPFNVGLIAEEIGVRALSRKNLAWMRRVAKAAVAERRWLARELERRGFRVYPSETNFLLVRPPVSPSGLARQLVRRGFVVKDLGKRPGVEGCLRITVAPRAIGARFLRALDRVLGGRR